MPSNYWTKRENLNYYNRVEHLAREFCPDGKTLLDVGGGVLWGAKYLERFADWNRTSIEYGADKGGSIEGVTVIQKDFRAHPLPKEPYDLVLCLQVLEHQHDKQIPEFVRRLLASGKTLIVSVPYKWTKGAVKSHLQDPIDEAKFLAWFPRRPKSIEVCHESGSHPPRLIAVF